MQSIDFDNKSLLEIERKIFHFIWVKSNSNPSSRSIDRIKRSVLKNEYSEGGLKATDVESLNMSLKLRQFIRAEKSNHVIRDIQLKCLEDSKNSEIFQQDYGIINMSEVEVKTAKNALNVIVEHNRKLISDNVEKSVECKKAINQVSSINIRQYLKKNNRVMALCIFNQAANDCENLLDLVRETETEIDIKRGRILEMILSNFPKEFRLLALNFDDNVNEVYNTIHEVKINNDKWIKLNDMSVKLMQPILKSELNKISKLDVKHKIGIEVYDDDNILRLRQQCKNTKMRSIYYRLINNDFFTHVRMFRFKMTNDDKCPRCLQIETMKHMLWECRESTNIWSLLNNKLSEISLESERILEYEDVFKVTNSSAITHIKMKIIQEMIQITRPSGWDKCKINKLILDISNIEKYISVKNKEIRKWDLKWKIFESLNGH